MYFLQHPDGTASAYVTNYGLFNQDHANADHAADRDISFVTATVCMEYSSVSGQGPTRIVKFFVFAGADFGPNAPRQAAADLDGFGPKFVPNLCLNCHGGSYGPPAAGPAFADINMGASFRELDIATYKFPEGEPTANTAEKTAFKQQNLIVKGATTDAISVDGIKKLIDGWYPTSSVDQDNTFTPTGWLGSPQNKLYHDVVKTSCRTCHIALGPGSGNQGDIDWTSYDQLKGRDFILKNYALCESRVMPHAVITYRNFWLSGSPHRPAVLRDFEKLPDWPALEPCAP
jgi:mono/diheme cytochrome c family protein